VLLVIECKEGARGSETRERSKEQEGTSSKKQETINNKREKRRKEE
jgi:hypothetical protein